MAIDTSISNKSAGTFKTFPEFSNLTINDRARYETFVRDFPPYSCMSFSNLMSWWNDLDCCKVALLNGNLVISYWIPGEEMASGLCVIGRKKIDETICSIFDYQRSKGERPRIVHVPDAVMGYIQYPELFSSKPEPGTDEYILATSKFYPLKRVVSFRRFKVRKFLARHPEESVCVKSLDLDLQTNCELLLDCAKDWRSTGILRNFVKHMDEAMDVVIDEANVLETQNLCLFVDGKLEAFILFHQTFDRRYVTLSHAIFNNDMPYTFDCAVYMFSQWFADHGISYANVDSDLDIPFLRMIKLAMGPDHYFRYHSIEPA